MKREPRWTRKLITAGLTVGCGGMPAPGMPAPGQLTEKDEKFRDSLGYIISLAIAWAKWQDPVSKRRRKEVNEIVGF